jgi:hypothetical protein
LNLNAFRFPILSIRNLQSAFRNQFTVTRSCGILTRFPCHNEANLQRPNLGLLLLHKAKSTHGIKNGSMIDRHLAEHLRDA